MQWFRADMHIHTVLSPCGGLDMSPVNIIRKAAEEKLDIIAITDHNSTKHCRLTQQIGERFGITVLAGAEVNTKEEIHCLVFFENIEKADCFQQIINDHLSLVINKPEIFGHQFVVDEKENILYEEEHLLVAALELGLDELTDIVRDLHGLWIPAHINRLQNSIYSQLGFLPAGLQADALEISRSGDYGKFINEHPEIEEFKLISNSDAHNLDQIGTSLSGFYMEKPDFNEIARALSATDQREIKLL
jgi:3',5'-nucleoside bisphosphate phosphatase